MTNIVRNKITISQAFMEVYEKETTLLPVLYCYLDLVFRRKNKNRDIKKRLNEVTEEISLDGKITKVGYYLLPSSSTQVALLEHKDSELYRTAYVHIFMRYIPMELRLDADDEVEEHYRLKIPSHKENVLCSIRKEYFIRMVESLNAVEDRELFLRMFVENSLGTYFQFTKKDIRYMFKKYVSNIEDKALYKRTDRFIEKLLKNKLIIQYGDYYSNAPSTEEFMKWSSQEVKDKFEEDANKLRYTTNSLHKVNKGNSIMIDYIQKYLSIDIIEEINEELTKNGIKTIK